MATLVITRGENYLGRGLALADSEQRLGPGLEVFFAIPRGFCSSPGNLDQNDDVGLYT